MDVSTYLFSDGNGRSAIELYSSALGAIVEHLSTFEEAPEFLRPPNGAHLVFHATLRIGATRINLSDDPRKERGHFGGFALLVHLDTIEEVDQRTASRSDQGGELLQEPQPTTWAARYAIAKDRYGVVWKLQYS